MKQSNLSIAANPKSSPSKLKELSEDEDWWVRERVALNPNTPVEVLEELSEDKNVDVLLAIYARVPREFFKDRYPWFKLGKRKITKKILEEILNTSPAEKFIRGI